MQRVAYSIVLASESIYILLLSGELLSGDVKFWAQLRFKVLLDNDSSEIQMFHSNARLNDNSSRHKFCLSLKINRLVESTFLSGHPCSSSLLFLAILKDRKNRIPIYSPINQSKN